ncbi:type II toxin-antitoxin system RelE/ParE family toxin [Francisella sp. XLW-1]|uniref:type II toxin-antitoxin system RelE/ParE family toxin n=1 Tax=Francisella sp. XLW-1 TaxID=2610887 RepID=UPI00123D4CBC|nr:type II toxin-antitoxin system RelE/ParE family toxin [Francisella sp. XLW-1]
MKLLKTKKFAQIAKKLKLEDVQLKDSLTEFISLDDNGKNRFSLGSQLYKIRVSFEGKGKSGSSRTIIVFKESSLTIWLHAFAKNDKANISDKELIDLKKLSKLLVNLTEDQIIDLINTNKLMEIDK